MHTLERDLGPGTQGVADTVLIVDDEPHLLDSTALLIESLGHRTIRLPDAAELVETASREPVGLILQDVSMRGLNLSGLVAMLRAHPDTAEIPLVFFGGQDDLAAMAARYDVWGYLSKPFDRGEMEAILHRVFTGSHLDDHGPSARHVRRQLQDLFHDQWDLICALNNYIQVLDTRVQEDGPSARCVEGMDATLLRLEAKTDRMRSYVLSLVDALEPIEPERQKQRPGQGSG